jgi:hypothetical protein
LAVAREDLLRLAGQSLAAVVPKGKANECLAEVLMSALAAAKTGSESSASSRIDVLLSEPTVSFQLYQRADTIRVPQREVDRDRVAVAAPDHDRRRGCERVDQRGRVIGLLVHVRDVRLRAFAPEVAAAVVHDRAPAGRQLAGGIAPEGSRAAGAMKAHDRLAGAVHLVVERHTVGADLGHATSITGQGIDERQPNSRIVSPSATTE